jgi:hypothetical protein
MIVYDLLVVQLDLAQKFHEVATCTSIPLDELTVNEEYSIVRARRLYLGRDGGLVALMLRKIYDPSNTYRIYLPQYYADIVSDKDIVDINDGVVWLNLVYKERNNDGSFFFEIA